MKLTKSEMQVVVDYLLVQHDWLFEMIVNEDLLHGDTCRKDELVLRKFLLHAKEKGLNIERALYSMDKKIKKLDKE